MKKALQLLGAIVIAGLLFSCNTANRFASSFEKRKYTKGHYAPSFSKAPLAFRTAAKAVAAQKGSSVTDIKKGCRPKPAQAKPFEVAALVKMPVKLSSTEEKNKVATMLTASISKTVGYSLINRALYNYHLVESSLPSDYIQNPKTLNVFAIMGFIACMIGGAIAILSLLIRSWQSFAAAVIIIGMALSVIGLVQCLWHRDKYWGAGFAWVGVIWLALALFSYLL